MQPYTFLVVVFPAFSFWLTETVMHRKGDFFRVTKPCISANEQYGMILANRKKQICVDFLGHSFDHFVKKFTPNQ